MYINNPNQDAFIVIITNYKLWVLLLCSLCKTAKFYFLKNTDPMNQIILFLFCRPTGPIFFAVLPVDQKINLISPNKEFIFNPDRYLTEDTSNTVNFKNVSSYSSNEILKLPCHFQYI